MIITSKIKIQIYLIVILHNGQSRNIFSLKTKLPFFPKTIQINTDIIHLNNKECKKGYRVYKYW
jgi:hypothetical protein